MSHREPKSMRDPKFVAVAPKVAKSHQHHNHQFSKLVRKKSRRNYKTHRKPKQLKVKQDRRNHMVPKYSVRKNKQFKSFATVRGGSKKNRFRPNSKKRNQKRLLINYGNFLRRIMLLVDKKSVDEIVPDDLKNQVYVPAGSKNKWKVKMTEEIIEVKNRQLHIASFATGDLDVILEDTT